MFMLGVDAMWEADVFGRIRRQIESAGAEYEASIEDYRDVLVSLFAEVAMAYLDIRAFQRRVKVAEANAAIQRKMVKLTRVRYKSGVASRLDMAQALSNLSNTEAAIPALEIGLNQAMNRLSVLLDEDAGRIQKRLEAPSPIPIPREAIGIGVPADLLLQRPDIRMAERRLAAQTARIGVATADLYPRFAIEGFLDLKRVRFQKSEAVPAWPGALKRLSNGIFSAAARPAAGLHFRRRLRNGTFFGMRKPY
jgi:multidrug efflux system outer membrane protein